jgi:hypothetical protein
MWSCFPRHAADGMLGCGRGWRHSALGSSGRKGQLCAGAVLLLTGVTLLISRRLHSGGTPSRQQCAH